FLWILAFARMTAEVEAFAPTSIHPEPAGAGVLGRRPCASQAAAWRTMVERSLRRGRQPSSAAARPEAATRVGGSPGRRGAGRVLTGRPQTAETVSTTSATE